MTDPAPPAASSGSGLRQILLATVIAGALGYVIQGVAYGMTDADGRIAFAVLWGAIYLVVSCLSGIQQELTRASSSSPQGTGARTWLLYTLVAAAATAIVITAVFAVLGPRMFPTDTASLVAAVVVACTGYALVASLSGAMYGVREWKGVAALTITDSALRALAITTALLAGASTMWLGWAIALPFIAAAALIWLFVGRRIRRHLMLDAPLRVLLRHTVATLLASLAMGMLISGLPVLLQLLAADAGTELRASLMQVTTLTRAPLVVPILALQGFLLVQFRDAGPALIPRLLKWLALIAAGVVVVAFAAAALGPWVMSWLYPAALPLPSADFGIIVLSGGLTALMCVTSQAVLAASRHTAYTSGWVLSAVATIAVLLLPLDAHTRILIAFLVGPVLGSAVHLAAVLRVRRAAS
ncbi:MAG: hypothetical protein LBE05_07065 [Microbacterium sp.]|jgi:hypothetical protein|nr:hypothetical protein [Microbacterium sp.]